MHTKLKRKKHHKGNINETFKNRTFDKFVDCLFDKLKEEGKNI